MVGPSGLEPPTLRLSVVRSSQLSYGPSSSQTALCSFPPSAKLHTAPFAPPLQIEPASLGFDLSFARGLFSVSPRVRRHKHFGRAKILAQGGIHFHRASEIGSRGPQKNASFFGDGGDSRDRTGDLLLARQALSQLSYIPSYL